MNVAYTIALAVLVILLAGLLGGAINALQTRKADEPGPKHHAYYFLLSIAAAFAVPLFLSLTKSELLKNVLAAKTVIEDWFIMFAVCLIAAVFAKSFLETVSEKLLQRMSAAEEEARKALAAAEKAKREAQEALMSIDTRDRSDEVTENVGASAGKKPTGVKFLDLDLSKYPLEQQKVLKSLIDPAFDRRTLGGISSDAGLSRQQVREILATLKSDEAVVEMPGEKTGKTYFQVQLDKLT